MDSEQIDILIRKTKEMQEFVTAAEKDIYLAKKTIEDKIKLLFEKTFKEVLSDALCKFTVKINSTLDFAIEIESIDKKCQKDDKWYVPEREGVYRYRECIPPCSKEQLEDLFKKIKEQINIEISIDNKQYLTIVT